MTNRRIGFCPGTTLAALGCEAAIRLHKAARVGDHRDDDGSVSISRGDRPFRPAEFRTVMFFPTSEQCPGMPTSDIKHFEPGPQASQVVVHSGIAYLVGVVCEDDSKDEYEQAKFILARIDQLLALAGTDKTRLLRGWLFVSDAQYHAGADRAWIEWMQGTATPARVSAVLGLGRPNFKVEIAVDAAVN